MDKQKTIFVGIFIAVVVLIVVLVFVLSFSQSRVPVPAPQTAEDAAPQSLGSELFEKTNNPLSGKLEAVNPAGNVNPIQNLYPNPFE